MRQSLHVCFISLSCFCIGACSLNSDTPNPKSFPYVLEEIETWNQRITPVDLDGDGRDEIVNISNGGFAVVLKTQDGIVIDKQDQDIVLRSDFGLSRTSISSR